MANTSINRAFSSSSVNTRATWSFWVKRNKVSAEQWLFQSRDAANNNYRTYIRFSSSGLLDMRLYNTSGSLIARLQTNRVFRDTSGWYHIVWKLNTTDNTPANRFKLYVNGVQETSFAETTNFTHNLDFRTVSSVNTCWGRNAPGNSEYFDGLLSHIHFIDGTDYDASAFGETDSTTGEWKAKTSPSVTYGTNGFFILKDGNGITDQSGEGNDFTLASGTLTDLKDNPDNTFATFNPLFVYSSGKKPAYSNGNNTATFDNAGENEHSPSTLAPSSGKYYAEFKWVSSHGDGSTGVGVFATDVNANNDINAQSYLYMGNGEKRMLNSASAYGASWTTGDIISIALDCDNNTVTFYKNGATQGALSIASGNNYYMYCTDYDNKVVNANFGNGFFGTTAITTNSGNGYSGAEGSSKFNYTVPTGYSALNTKGLNE